MDTVIGSPERIFWRVRRRLTSGDIILMHDTSEKSLRALEYLLQYFQENNYKSVTVNQLIKF